MNNEFFLNALLEMPRHSRRVGRTFEWLSAHGIHIVIGRGADHRAAIHHGDNSPERISRIPVVASTAALGTAPGPAGGTVARISRTQRQVELHAATTDGLLRSEDRFRRLR